MYKNRQTPYFENEFCSCYKADIIPQNISPYVVNPNNQLTKMFTISTPENNYIYMKYDAYYDAQDNLKNKDIYFNVGFRDYQSCD